MTFEISSCAGFGSKCDLTMLLVINLADSHPESDWTVSKRTSPTFPLLSSEMLRIATFATSKWIGAPLLILILLIYFPIATVMFVTKTVDMDLFVPGSRSI